MILNSKRLKDERNKTEKFQNDEQIVGSSYHETEEDETLAS